MSPLSVDRLPAAHVIEAAIVAYCDRLGIDDPQQAAARVGALAHDVGDVDSLHALIARAGNDATDDVVAILRLLMSTGEASGADAGLQRALLSAGEKQLVITPDHLVLAAAVVVALMVFKPPKSGEQRRVQIEENPDGRKKVTIDEKVTYLNPTSALVALIERVMRGIGGEGGGGAGP